MIQKPSVLKSTTRPTISLIAKAAIVAACGVVIVFATVTTTGTASVSHAAASQTAVTPKATNRQELDFAGAPIPFEAVRKEARQPLQVASAKELELRLANGGELEIGNSPLIVGSVNRDQRGHAYIAVDRLILKGKQASIVTNGADVVIVANVIESHGGTIRAFTPSSTIASSGTNPGEKGERGASGGSVTLLTVRGIEGRLDVNLTGQQGGSGAQGHTGNVGDAGRKGRNASSAGLWCNHAGDDGEAGKKGDRGLTGGAAGPGGDGGTFSVYRLDAKPIPSAGITYVLDGGKPGVPGAGGTGGRGGTGGEGGNGDGACGGGRAGSQGATGDAGESGATASNGTAGNATIKTLPLEAILRETTFLNPQ
jgi:hypothetical protein